MQPLHYYIDFLLLTINVCLSDANQFKDAFIKAQTENGASLEASGDADDDEDDEEEDKEDAKDEAKEEEKKEPAEAAKDS